MNKKSWTVMVYLAGDNNLDSAGVADLAEMKKVGSTDHINVVAQFDREAKGSQTRRYYLRKGGVLDSDVVANLGETNTGDPNVLIDFVQWTVKKYPSDRYLLVVWNHGNGWDDSDVYGIARNTVGASITRRKNVVERSANGNDRSVSLRRLRAIGSGGFRRALFRTSVAAAVQTRGIAYDDNAQDFLDNLELQRVLVAAKKTLGKNVDVLGLDACLMSMAEVGYENRVAADVTVGSEQIEPGDGWPYQTILADLAKKPQMSARDLGATIVKRYLASYAADAQVTQAACDLKQADALAKSVSQMADALRSGLTNAQSRAGILEARTQVQSYETPDYVDLQDLCDLLEKKCARSQPIVDASKAVRAAIGNYVIASGSKGPSVAHSHGVSIHFPNNPREPLSPLYAKLDFAKDTTWDEFLKAWLAALQQR